MNESHHLVSSLFRSLIPSFSSFFFISFLCPSSFLFSPSRNDAFALNEQLYAKVYNELLISDRTLSFLAIFDRKKKLWTLKLTICAKISSSWKTNPFLSATEANNGNQARSNSVLTTQNDASSHAIGKTSFAVPAPPPLAPGEKNRRLSDTEHFRQPNVTVVGHAAVQKQLQEAQTQAQAQALADMILKVKNRKLKSSTLIFFFFPSRKSKFCKFCRERLKWLSNERPRIQVRGSS